MRLVTGEDKTDHEFPSCQVSEANNQIFIIIWVNHGGKPALIVRENQFGHADSVVLRFVQEWYI